jgi:peptidoglycan hydrolase-like protein with peptidoglycan-binding domain
MNFPRTMPIAVISALLALCVPMEAAYADGEDAFVGALLGSAMGSVITNTYFNNGSYDRYRDRHYSRHHDRYYGRPYYDDGPSPRKVWRNSRYLERQNYVAPESSEGVRIQQALAVTGFYSGQFDGRLDSYESRSAIMEYQKKYGLSPTGVLQQEVKSLLIYQGEVAVLSNYLSYLGYERNDKARRLQAALKVMGFYSSLIDGLIGGQTMDAVRLYQQSKGMPVSGVLLPAEEDELVSEAKDKLQQQRKQAEDQLAQFVDRSGQAATQ